MSHLLVVDAAILKTAIEALRRAGETLGHPVKIEIANELADSIQAVEQVVYLQQEGDAPMFEQPLAKVNEDARDLCKRALVLYPQ